MLQVLYSTDKSILEPLEAELFPDSKEGGVKAVLYDDNTPVGLCILRVTDVVEIADFAVKSAYNSFEVIDFFFRVILFKLSLMDYDVYVRKQDERLVKFGFAPVEGGMSVFSKNIQFPSSCKK